MWRRSVPILLGRPPASVVYDIGPGDDSAIGGSVNVADDVGVVVGSLMLEDEA